MNVQEIPIQHWKDNRHVKLAPVICRMQMNSIFSVHHVIVVHLLLKMGYVLPVRLGNTQIQNIQNVLLIVMMERLRKGCVSPINKQNVIPGHIWLMVIAWNAMPGIIASVDKQVCKFVPRGLFPPQLNRNAQNVQMGIQQILMEHHMLLQLIYQQYARLKRQN